MVQGAVWGVAFDSGAERAATGSADFTAYVLVAHAHTISKLWSAGTGDELASLMHPHIVKSVDFSAVSGGIVVLRVCVRDPNAFLRGPNDCLGPAALGDSM